MEKYVLQLPEGIKPTEVYGKFLLCTQNKICSLASREEIFFPETDKTDRDLYQYYGLEEKKYIPGVGILFTFSYYDSYKREHRSKEKKEQSCFLFEAKEEFLGNTYFHYIYIKSNVIHAFDYSREYIYNLNGELIIEKDYSKIKNGNGEVIYEKVNGSYLILVENENKEVVGLGIEVERWEFEYYPL